MTLIRHSPVVDVVTFRDAIDRLFDDRLLRPVWPWDGEREVVPRLDLYMTPEAVVARVALPGVKPEDIDISISDDVVAIRGSFQEQKETTEAGYVRKELNSGSFSRTFALPTAVKNEAATASFAEGLLTLTMPKSDEVKPTHVKIQAAA